MRFRIEGRMDSVAPKAKKKSPVSEAKTALRPLRAIYRMALAREIAARRTDHEPLMPQKKLGELMGWSRNKTQKVERGRSKVELGDAVIAAEHFGIDPLELLRAVLERAAKKRRSLGKKQAQET